MQQFFDTITNLILPNQCITCHSLSECNLCNNCIQKIPSANNLWIKENLHQNIIFKPKTHTKIKTINKNSYLNAILSCTDFKHKIIKKSVHYLKYKNLPQLAIPMGTIMLRALSQHLKNTSDIILCPIPLHTSRLKFRGYNQADLLAKYLQKKLRLPIYLNLERIRNTPQQMRIKNKSSRIQNMNDAFIASKKNNLKQTIILIDDVTTTLSTIEQAAKALSKQGFEDIYALILAH